MEETAASAEEMFAASEEMEKSVQVIAARAQEGAAHSGELNKRA